ncbi:MAG: hypothetical protein M3P48_00430 [Actinomycetota bacterium]|nr:hypothetical protein [Actinomycetota bacterium]
MNDTALDFRAKHDHQQLIGTRRSRQQETEEEVAARLRALDGRWKMLRADPVGEMGRASAINTKHRPDGAIQAGGNTVLVDGHRVPSSATAGLSRADGGAFLTDASGGSPWRRPAGSPSWASARAPA